MSKLLKIMVKLLKEIGMKMSSRLMLFALLFLTLASTSVSAKSFGSGLSLQKMTLLSEVLANPEPFIGQKVQIKGMIVDVCQSRGCWIYLAGDKQFEKIRVKVTDGEIVFPMEARGRAATVEGVLQKFELSREDIIAKEKHYAEEQGRKFDPSSIKSGETIYQLRGLGAEVEGI
jgi:Domain of unknown function (DUF4920)